MAVAKLLRSGNVGINTAQRNHEAPFGGFKFCGVGRDGGSLRACTPTASCSRSSGPDDRADDRAATEGDR